MNVQILVETTLVFYKIPNTRKHFKFQSVLFCANKVLFIKEPMFSSVVFYTMDAYKHLEGSRLPYVCVCLVNNSVVGEGWLYPAWKLLIAPSLYHSGPFIQLAS